MFKISVGTSSDPDPAEAVGALVAQCLDRFGGTSPKAGILINVGHDRDATILQTIRDTWPQMRLIGSASGKGGADKRLTLMLLDSPDLEFHFGIGRHASLNPGLAAEQALSDAASSVMDRIVMCLTLPDALAEWNLQFGESMSKLLPPGTTRLRELLPADSDLNQAGVDRYYSGTEVLTDSIPILVAVSPTTNKHLPGWSLTREQGIVRRDCGDHVYEYDTLIGDRRRSARAS